MSEQPCTSFDPSPSVTVVDHAKSAPNREVDLAKIEKLTSNPYTRHLQRPDPRELEWAARQYPPLATWQLRHPTTVRGAWSVKGEWVSTLHDVDSNCPGDRLTPTKATRLTPALPPAIERPDYVELTHDELYLVWGIQASRQALGHPLTVTFCVNCLMENPLHA